MSSHENKYVGMSYEDYQNSQNSKGILLLCTALSFSTPPGCYIKYTVSAIVLILNMD